MISAKAILALTLTSLGAGVAAHDIYEANRPAQPERWERLAWPATPEHVELTAEPPAADEDHVVVMLSPVLVVGRLPPARDLTPPSAPRALVPCSAWRALESGPAGRGVRVLCDPSVAQPPRLD